MDDLNIGLMEQRLASRSDETDLNESKKIAAGLELLLLEAQKTGVITSDQESALISCISAGRSAAESDEARKTLVQANMRLVLSIANRYRRRGLPIEDLVQEGALGLLTAIDKFNPNLGYRFITYAAHWIRHAISGAVRNAYPIRLPPKYYRMHKVKRMLAEVLAREPTDAELAAEMNLSEQKIRELLQCASWPVSLNDPASCCGDSHMTNAQEAPLHNPVVASTQSGQREELITILGELPAQERSILMLRYGIHDSVSRSVEDVSHILRLSREEVRIQEVKALIRLRKLHKQCAQRLDER